MKKIFRVEVWIDDKHFHTLQGEVSHVRNRRLALTQIFRNILRGNLRFNFFFHSYAASFPRHG